MDNLKLANTVRGRREFLRLKQEDLSELSGVGLKTIFKIESGIGNPSIGTLNRLLTTLGLELKIQVKSKIDGEGSGI